MGFVLVVAWEGLLGRGDVVGGGWVVMDGG